MSAGSERISDLQQQEIDLRLNQNYSDLFFFRFIFEMWRMSGGGFFFSSKRFLSSHYPITIIPTFYPAPQMLGGGGLWAANDNG